MSKSDPAWLPAAREFCRTTGINIMGWGPHMLTLEAKSPDRAREIASQLGQFGLKIVENEDDAYAGLLNLSPDPEAILAIEREFRSRYSGFSRRPPIDLLTPAFELTFSMFFFWVCAVESGSKSAKFAVMGSVLLLLFVWDGLRIWGWNLQISAQELRVRRFFAWKAIPWTDIRSVQARAGGRYQETVTLTLVSDKSLNLGRFGFSICACLARPLAAADLAKPTRIEIVNGELPDEAFDFGESKTMEHERGKRVGTPGWDNVYRLVGQNSCRYVVLTILFAFVTGANTLAVLFGTRFLPHRNLVIMLWTLPASLICTSLFGYILVNALNELSRLVKQE